MSGKQFGFKVERREDKEPSELEERLGTRFVPIKDEPYLNHVDNWSEFRSLANETVQGIYRGKNDNGLYVFSPFIEVYASKIDRKGRLKKPKYFINDGIKTLNALHQLISTKDLDARVIRVFIPDFNPTGCTK